MPVKRRRQLLRNKSSIPFKVLHHSSWISYSSCYQWHSVRSNLSSVRGMRFKRSFEIIACIKDFETSHTLLVIYTFYTAYFFENEVPFWLKQIFLRVWPWQTNDVKSFSTHYTISLSDCWTISYYQLNFTLDTLNNIQYRFGNISSIAWRS